MPTCESFPTRVQQPLAEEQGQRAGVIPVGLARRLLDDLELTGVDDDALGHKGRHLLVKEARVARRLDGDIIIRAQDALERLQLFEQVLLEGAGAALVEEADGEVV